VESAGFKKLEHKGVAVATQALVTLDLALELGQVTESVNVTGDAPALETADASTGQLIDTQQITDLPILGRNPYFEAKLGQGVVFAANPKFARMQDQNGNSQVSIAGGPMRTNNYLVDGISIADSNNRAVIVPSPEAVQELKLQTTTFDAEVSRTGGGAFDTVLRSGSNELHGSAVGHTRQTDWLANNFFANKAGQPIANQPFYDWAFSLGGPVYIPKVYDGRNKTFFFASDESYRETDGSTTVLSVPTPLELTGNFSQSFTKSGAQEIIYNPLALTSTGARIPFANNIIPISQQNPIGQLLASYYPAPNAATPYYGAPNYNFTGSYPNRGDQRLFKLDQQITSWFRASASFIYQRTFETDYPTNIFPNVASPNQTLCCDRKIDATQANATLTPNATTVIAIRWGFNRFYSKSTQESAGFNVASLGLPASLAASTPNTAFPAITTSGSDYSSYGGGTTAQDVFYSRNFNTVISKFLGKHSVKAGFDFRTIHDFGTPASGPTSFTFSNAYTQANAASATTGTGSSLATMLLGYPTAGQQTIVSNFNDFIRYYGVFVQDDYRITPKLTLNFGLRFEHESGIQEENNHLITGFNTTAANPLQQSVSGLQVPGEVQYAGVSGAPTQTGSPLSVKPAVRFGLAYSLDSKTVIRGGYGIFWAPTFFNYQNTIGYSQTTTIAVPSTSNAVAPAATLNNPYPNGLLQPTGNTLAGLSGVGQGITVLSPTAGSAGYVQEYSLQVQRELPQGWVLTVGSIGSHGLHLLQGGENIDQLNPSLFPLAQAEVKATPTVTNPFYGNGGVGTIGTPTVSPIQLLLPYPQYTASSGVSVSNADTGSSFYYAFFLRAQHRFSNGLSLLASYTWSRSKDDLTNVSLAGASGVGNVAGPQNVYNLAGEWSLSAQDTPNRFTTAITYELPVGKGKLLLHNTNRVLDWAVGGWSANAVSTIQNGYPLSVVQTNNNSAIGGSYQRPNATGLAVATTGSTDSRINDWLNASAFSTAPAYTFGDVSRFLPVRGPGLFNWDVSLNKSFVVKERYKAQFRAEALNATNTVYFGNPTLSINSSTFGQITSQINNPRMIQLGIRVNF
jgi:hypothetical protein